ncbi:MAG: hypothetical protein ACOX6T_21570 [Myxococcales bacterium]|jgi:hypothetical protein
MRLLRYALPIALTAALLACGEEEEVNEPGHTIASTPLAGKIHGKPWTFVAGATSNFLSDDEGLFTKLYPAELSCQHFHGGDATEFILLQVPGQPGRYPLSLARNVTLVTEKAAGETLNMVAISGVLEVSEVTDTGLKGGLYARIDADYEVDGQFSASICE